MAGMGKPNTHPCDRLGGGRSPSASAISGDMSRHRAAILWAHAVQAASAPCRHLSTPALLSCPKSAKRSGCQHRPAGLLCRATTPSQWFRASSWRLEWAASSATPTRLGRRARRRISAGFRVRVDLGAGRAGKEVAVCTDRRTGVLAGWGTSWPLSLKAQASHGGHSRFQLWGSRVSWRRGERRAVHECLLALLYAPLLRPASFCLSNINSIRLTNRIFSSMARWRRKD